MKVDEPMGYIVFTIWTLAAVKRALALTERGSGAVMARARVAKEMREKRAILGRESMTESWSRRASRDDNEESLGSE